MNDTWPDLQRPQRTEGLNEHREDPVSNPAELAGYAADANSGEPDAERSFVDLGFADEQAAEGDEFGSLDVDEDIELDAA